MPQIPRSFVQADRLPVSTARVLAPPIELRAPRYNLSDGGQANRAMGDLSQALDVVGEAASRIADRRVAARRQTELMTAQAGAERELNDAWLALSQSTDYASLEAAWNDRAPAIRGKYLDGISDAATKTEFGARFDQLAEAKRVTISQRAFTLEGETNRATLDLLAADRARAYAGANPLERQAIVQNTEADLQNAYRVGWIQPEDAVKRFQDFLGKADEADVRGLITADPEQAIVALVGSARFQNLDPNQRAQFLDSATTRANALQADRLAKSRQADEDARRLLKDQGDALAKQGFQLASEGNLTRDWLDQFQGALGLDDYKVLLDKIDPTKAPPVHSDRDTKAALWDLVAIDPVQAAADAKQAYRAHLLSDDDLDRFMNESQQRIDAGIGPNKLKTVYDWNVEKIKSAFGQSLFTNFDADKAARQNDALRDLQDRARDLDRNDAAIDAVGDELVRRYSTNSAAVMPNLVYGLRLTLPTTSVDATASLAQLSAYARTIAARQDPTSPEAAQLGLLTPAQAIAESRAIQKWFAALRTGQSTLPAALPRTR